ncbi:MAG: PAS domain S-box protein [Bacteroidota bacterium]|nr:PAS domain S-box protein [Bacteroidota bacterium]
MNRRNIKILFIDDDEDDFFLTKELFEEMPGYTVQVDWTPSIEDGVKSLKHKSHEVYFVDYLLGSNTGIDFLRSAWHLGNTYPIIMLTGKGDHDIDKMAMELGAADYLVKSELDVEKLERCLRYAVGRYETRIQLEESEAKYRNIFERTRDMIFITDIIGTVIDTNESVSRVLGYSKEEIIGKKLPDLIDDPTSREFIVEQITNKTEFHDFEQVILSKSGKRKICLMSLSFQGDEINNPTFLGVIHDITKRRRAEQDLITTEKLAVTGRIVRMIAHEIRNPLTNINLSLEQLEAELPTNPDLKMYFDIIKRNSERISSLITELLNSSKPAQLTISKYSINNLIKETLALIQDRIVLRSVRVVTNLSDDICEISVDSGKIKIALLNIFINAIEAMDDVGGVLTIATRGEDNCCVIEIEDNGKGIPESDIGRIFDPFFSGKPKGTGLGLSTTHNIIRTHNGSIDVTSAPGTGTKFIVKLNFDSNN